MTFYCAACDHPLFETVEMQQGDILSAAKVTKVLDKGLGMPVDGTPIICPKCNASQIYTYDKGVKTYV